VKLLLHSAGDGDQSVTELAVSLAAVTSLPVTRWVVVAVSLAARLV
jgi:hypothetical protein